MSSLSSLLFILTAEAQETGSVSSIESEQLEFSKFDIKRVLQHGEPLVGSSGAEYELPDEDLAGKCDTLIVDIMNYFYQKLIKKY